MELIPTGGCHDCGAKCPYKVWVENGVAKRIEPYEDLRPCIRGYAYLERLYSPERLKAPLKRVGERGEGKFKEISWDEALDTVAGELLRVKQTYGNAAIMGVLGSAYQGHLHNSGVLQRLLNMFGGYTGLWGSMSAEAKAAASTITYGTFNTGHSQDDILATKLVVMFGANPAVTTNGTDSTFSLIRAKEKGIRFIAFDPRYSNSIAILADQWIPIYPGTDAAVLLAMAHVIITENLYDRKFLDTYTVGFDKFADYVLGKEDGLAKTPAWAEPLTGVDAKVTEQVAREYATNKPAVILSGNAPGRTAYGEQFHRATHALAAMTGNIGVHGGSPAGMGRLPGGAPGERLSLGPSLPTGKNAVEKEDLGPMMGSPVLDSNKKNRYRVNSTQVWDAILKGKAGGYPADIKLLYVVMRNIVNQYPNTNKTREALKNVEFFVTHDQFLTPSGKFADIILPVTTHWEKTDFLRSHTTYFILANKVVNPLPGSKSDFEVCAELARRLGLPAYSTKTEDEWLKEIIAMGPDSSKEIKDYDQLKKDGLHRMKPVEPVVAFTEQINDPEHNRFPTPSGKIEIFSQRLADLNNPLTPPIPKYIPTWEGREDPLFQQYPLQLVTFHVKTRTHSTFYNIASVRELDHRTTRSVWINPVDAEKRGITDGEKVRVFNGRGEMVIEAFVTNRIMPGVVAIGEGSWYQPDENWLDHGGCANVLTRDQPSPMGSHASNTSLVQVERR
ncbi:MAG: molybdopterin-dependent oxidoreductase [Chloroflexota bacterium]